MRQVGRQVDRQLIGGRNSREEQESKADETNLALVIYRKMEGKKDKKTKSQKIPGHKRQNTSK